MIFEILSLFPNMFEGVFADSIIRRAVDKGLVSIAVSDLRQWSRDPRHGTVDDYLYGGEPGMLIKPEPLADAIGSIKAKYPQGSPKVVFMTPLGKPLSQPVVNQFLDQEQLIVICGRYKGIDQRICDTLVDYEVSVGDFVLSGGEIPAMALVDAITRLIPGVLSDRESAENDSFYKGLLSPPHYTRPEVFNGQSVPSVLLSGHHARIEQWSFQQACERTKRYRPDIWEQWVRLQQESRECKK